MMLAMVLATGAAQASEKKDEGRFIITPANGNDDNMINVTVGLNSIVMVSLALIGVVIAVVVVSQLTDQSKEEATYHSAPS